MLVFILGDVGRVLKTTRMCGLVPLPYSSETVKSVLRPHIKDKCCDILREREGGWQARTRFGVRRSAFKSWLCHFVFMSQVASPSELEFHQQKMGVVGRVK